MRTPSNFKKLHPPVPSLKGGKTSAVQFRASGKAAKDGTQGLHGRCGPEMTGPGNQHSEGEEPLSLRRGRLEGREPLDVRHGQANTV
jgi:hypothetical protein